MTLVSDLTFPRTSTVRDLIHAIRYQPKLAKDASSALIDIGQAMQGNATRDETSEFFRGTLYQEVYVRTSCLQALQVSSEPSDRIHRNLCSYVALRPHRLRLVSRALDRVP